MKAKFLQRIGKLWRRAKYHHCRYMIAHHQAQLDSIAMQRANDEEAAEFIQGRIERRVHKARALRDAA